MLLAILSALILMSANDTLLTGADRLNQLDNVDDASALDAFTPR